MYLYAFENHKCQKSTVRADKNDILEKHQKSPILVDFVHLYIKFIFIFIMFLLNIIKMFI